MDRRTYLRALVAAAASSAAGCGGGPTATPEEDSPGSSPDEGTLSPTDEPATSPGTSPTDEPSPTDGAGTTDTATATPTSTPRPSVAAEVIVGVDGKFRFEPENVEIATGETVRWLWEAGGHNVKPERTPNGSDWSGTPGDDSKTFSKGYAYTHEFTVAGQYDYVCIPHRTYGMEGTVVVK